MNGDQYSGSATVLFLPETQIDVQIVSTPYGCEFTGIVVDGVPASGSTIEVSAGSVVNLELNQQ